jgi:hypothetical protein
VSAIAADLSSFLKERADKRKQCVRCAAAATTPAFSPFPLKLLLSLPPSPSLSPSNHQPPPPCRYMTDGEKRLLDLKDACHHEGKMKAALEKAKADAAAGEREAE